MAEEFSVADFAAPKEDEFSLTDFQPQRRTITAPDVAAGINQTLSASRVPLDILSNPAAIAASDMGQQQGKAQRQRASDADIGMVAPGSFFPTRPSSPTPEDISRARAPIEALKALPGQALAAGVRTVRDVLSPSTYLPEAMKEPPPFVISREGELRPQTAAEQLRRDPIQGGRPLLPVRGTQLNPEGSDMEKQVASLSTLDNIALIAAGGASKVAGTAILATMAPGVLEDITKIASSKVPMDEKRDSINNLLVPVFLALRHGAKGEALPDMPANLAESLRQAPLNAPETQPQPITAPGRRISAPDQFVTQQQALDFARRGDPIRRGVEQANVPNEAAIGQPTYEPSGLGRPVVTPPETQLPAATIPASPELKAMAAKGPTAEIQPPPPTIAPEYTSGQAAQRVRVMGEAQQRAADFEKAVAERVTQEQAEPLHPDKPLTANQLRIISDSLIQSITDNQLPGKSKGLIVGSDLEAWADGVINKGGQRTRFGGIDPELAAAGIVKGAALLERGVTEFVKWSAEMIKEFGENIKPKLREMFDHAKGLRAEPFTKKPDDPISAFEKESGWTAKRGQPGAAVAQPTPEQFAAMPEAERKMYADLADMQGTPVEFTDRRKGSPTERVTFYVANGAKATAGEIRAAHQNKLKQFGQPTTPDPVAPKAENPTVAEKPAAPENPERIESQPLDPRTGSPLSATEGLINRLEPLKFPESGQLALNPVLAFAKPIIEGLRKVRGVLGQRFANMAPRHLVDQLADAADNRAAILGRELGNRIALKAKRSPVADVSGSAAIAVGFDPAKLPSLLASVAGKNPAAEAGIRYAIANWPESEQIGRAGQDIFDFQNVSENQAGINTLYTENYLPGVADTDLWMGHNRPFVIGRSTGGTASSFKKGKTYATPFDAIAADAYEPKTLELSKLVEHRVKQGQRMINRLEYGNQLRSVVAPSDGKAVVADLVHKSRGPGQPAFDVPPVGYVARELLPGHRIAVHEDFAKLFDAVTGQSSAIAQFEPGGIPIGEAALQAEGAVKHGLLLFDTYHAVRIMAKQMFLTRDIPSYRKGFSLLEYTDRDLSKAVSQGEIDAKTATWVRANRADAELAVTSGLNVGRIQEAMYSGLVRGLQESIAKGAKSIGVPGRVAEKIEFNKWVFDKMTRGAMLEGWLSEFNRTMGQNPGMTRGKAALKVSRDLNAYFGNLGRQGVFKSPTMLDASRLAMLAPQWVESMARSEILGAGQLAKGAVDSAMNRRLMVGSLGTGLAQGLIAYMVGTQVLNLITRKQFTWKNEEKGHKLDAWIPDITGKSNGFFLSPLSMVAEISHDLLRYYESSKAPDTSSKLADAASHIQRNKMSPLWRAGSIIVNGRDFNDQKIVKFTDRVKAAGWALAPAPIGVSPIIKGGAPAGAMQRQLTASMGIKTEPAGSNLQQMSQLSHDWMAQSKDPKIKAKYDRELAADFGESDYKGLRTALQSEDYAAASKALDDLKEKGKKTSDIAKVMRPTTADMLPKPVPGLSQAQTSKFLRSLPPEQKKVWDAAKKERKEQFQRYLKLLRDVRKPSEAPMPAGLPST